MTRFLKIVMTGFFCLSLCSCSAAEESPSPLQISSAPSSSPEVTNDASSEDTKAAVSRILSGFYSEESIGTPSPKGTTLEIKVTYDGDTSGTTTPDDWDTTVETAISAGTVLSEEMSGDTYSNIVIQLVDSDGNIILNVANGKERYSKYSLSGSSTNPSTITLEEFNAIETGMGFQEVFDIIGGRGEVLSESDLGLGDEYRTIIFTWDGEGSIGANANVTFQGSKVISKAQFGLE